MPNIGDIQKIGYIVAISKDDIWAAGGIWGEGPPDPGETRSGTRSLVIHFNGQNWTRVPAPDPSYIQNLESIVATSKNDIWVAGGSWDDEDSSGRALIAHFVRCSSDTK